MNRNGTNMVLKWIQKQSNIDAQINWQIDVQLAIQKLNKHRTLERHRVAKGTWGIRKRGVSGLEGSPGTIENRTLWPLDHPHVIPTRRWAEGPANIYIYIYILSSSEKNCLAVFSSFSLSCCEPKWIQFFRVFCKLEEKWKNGKKLTFVLPVFSKQQLAVFYQFSQNGSRSLKEWVRIAT